MEIFRIQFIRLTHPVSGWRTHWLMDCLVDWLIDFFQLRHSFVHAGHGDLDPSKTFGNPAAIDDLYLRNPVPALDLLAQPSSSSDQKDATITSTLPKPPHPNGAVDTADILLDLLDHAQIGNPAQASSSCMPPSQPPVTYGNDFGPPEVNYFNLPPGGTSLPPQTQSIPSAPAYHYYSPQQLPGSGFQSYSNPPQVENLWLKVG